MQAGNIQKSFELMEQKGTIFKIVWEKWRIKSNFFECLKDSLSGEEKVTLDRIRKITGIFTLKLVEKVVLDRIRKARDRKGGLVSVDLSR